MRYTPLLLSLLFSGTALAQDDTGTVVVPPPPLPSGIEDETIEPEVSIIRRDDRIMEEFRLNGQLYMVKVTPKKGVPYYLVDADGDGNLDTQSNELDPKILVPSWVIFRW